MNFLLANKDAEARKIVDGTAKVSQETARAALRSLIDVNARVSKEQTKEMEKAASATSTELTVVIVVGAIFAIAIGFFLSKLIGSTVLRLTDAANRLAVGDVNVAVTVNSKDELESLAASFQSMIENIKPQTAAADRLAAGDLKVELRAKSDVDTLSQSFITLVQTLRGLVTEANRMAGAALEATSRIEATLPGSRAATISSRASTTRWTR